ncbi:hypothetical protein GUJ93_ZPchr0010g8877 [Zizania palustris]|uniref:Uncharacterized protein n=1 Tax=Zizania palustris TaxID=103762 RepID=A0A8J5TBQ6_ZIZPA|nr:hypothetical protein GUJ93_ZPchr0010g8877 [Zizania palustris]
MEEGAEEALVIEPKDWGQIQALEIQMAELRDPRQANAEGFQTAESGASEPRHLEGAQATEPEASVAMDTGVATAEEGGP